jgi:glucose 1-dehydrogenase
MSGISAGNTEEPASKRLKKDNFADTKPLLGKVALITGSSEGIGSGVALELAMAGADICVNYVGDGDSDAEEIAQQIRSFGRRALIVKANVADREATEAMFSTLEKELGVIDILVTSAMSAKRHSILDTKPEDFKRTMDIGVFGVFNCMQLAAKQMIAAGKKGSMVHITSPHQSWPAKDAIDYNTAKAAAHHLALSVANELMWKGIRVNFVEPGWTITKNEIRLFGIDQLNENGKKMPFGRLANPADSARAVLWLCSEEASFVVGTTIKCDSGMFIEGGQSWNSAPRERV